ncbi:MAG: VanZ family protein [Fidelibacterota bacterium]
MNNKNIKQLTLAYLALILTLSSIPGQSMPPLAILTFDKGIHFIEYGILGVLVGRYLFSVKRSILLGFIFCAIFGAVDESWQLMIPGRFSSVYDWIADVSGSITGLIIAFKVHK